MFKIAVGDIHGRLDKLNALLNEVECYFREEHQGEDTPHRFIFLGDYIDRGPHSYQCMKLVKSMVDAGSAVALMGNHEDLMVQAEFDHHANMVWLNNGGNKVMGYDSIEGQPERVKEMRDFAKTLPLFYEDNLRIFVHAGINPVCPIEEQTKEDLVWIREPFLMAKGPYEVNKFIVHGHTPVAYDGNKLMDAPVIKEHRMNLDTGAVFGGKLTAAFFNDKQTKPFHVITV